MKNDLEEWLGILENTTKDQRSREDAALQIARLRDKSMVPRLLKLIPDVNQSVTVSIAHALGEIGDPRALPALRQLAEVKSLQGPYRTLVLRAIENCEKTSEKR